METLVKQNPPPLVPFYKRHQRWKLPHAYYLFIGSRGGRPTPPVGSLTKVLYQVINVVEYWQ
jgi:hypothetical protein